MSKHSPTTFREIFLRFDCESVLEPQTFYVKATLHTWQAVLKLDEHFGNGSQGLFVIRCRYDELIQCAECFPGDVVPGQIHVEVACTEIARERQGVHIAPGSRRGMSLTFLLVSIENEAVCQNPRLRKGIVGGVIVDAIAEFPVAVCAGQRVLNARAAHFTAMLSKQLRVS